MSSSYLINNNFRMEPSLKMAIEPVKDGYQVVKFTGEFDKAGHSDVKESLEKDINNFSAGTLVFDFSDLKFINSEGIGYLMEIHTHLVKAGKKFVIAGLQTNVKDVFEAIGISQTITVFDSFDDFLRKQ